MSNHEFETLNDQLKEIKLLLTGNGQPRNGLIVRVVQLEDAEKRRQWWMRTTIGAAIVAIFTTVWGFIKFGK